MGGRKKKVKEERGTPSPVCSPHPFARATPSPRHGYMQLVSGGGGAGMGGYHGPPPNVMVQQGGHPQMQPHMGGPPLMPPPGHPQQQPPHHLIGEPPPGAAPRPLPPPPPLLPQSPSPLCAMELDSFLLELDSEQATTTVLDSGGPSHAFLPLQPYYEPFPTFHHLPFPHHQPHTPPAFFRMRVGPPAMHPPSFIPHPPAFSLESRIYDMNKRMMQRIDKANEAEAQWWEAFGNEFFDDNARIMLQCQLDDGPKKYSIGRTLIPRYFRSIFDGGVKDMFYVLRGPSREFMARHDLLVLEVENAAVVTRHESPKYTEVNTEGRLYVEFSVSEEFMNMPPRIRLWVFEIRTHQEFVLRNVLSTLAASPSPEERDALTKNITRQGMTSVTLNYLRLCLILEPMQNLMSIHKGHGISPRECLGHYNFQRHIASQPRRPPQAPPPISQPIIPPLDAAEPPRAAPKRKRNRKGSNSGAATPAGKKKVSNPAAASPAPGPPPPNFALTSHVDVMVVGEPSLMGGEFGDEDERMISRMENTQFDPASGLPLPAGVMPPMPPEGRGTPYGGMWPQGGGSRGGTPLGMVVGGPAASPSVARLIKSEGPDMLSRTPPLPPS